MCPQKGTGKTKTVVAATEVIIRSSQQNNVLICADSNSACDEIAERLIAIFDNNEMLRLYASSHSLPKLPMKLRPFSNLDWHGDQFIIPSLTELYGFRVIICTLATASNFTRLNHQINYKPSHFSHIFIDECANTCEAMTMVAIAGNNNCTGNIKKYYIEN